MLKPRRASHTKVPFTSDHSVAPPAAQADERPRPDGDPRAEERTASDVRDEQVVDDGTQSGHAIRAPAEGQADGLKGHDRRRDHEPRRSAAPGHAESSITKVRDDIPATQSEVARARVRRDRDRPGHSAEDVRRGGEGRYSRGPPGVGNGNDPGDRHSSHGLRLPIP